MSILYPLLRNLIFTNIRNIYEHIRNKLKNFTRVLYFGFQFSDSRLTTHASRSYPSKMHGIRIGMENTKTNQ